jgi:hypothetical protein
VVNGKSQAAVPWEPPTVKNLGDARIVAVLNTIRPKHSIFDERRRSAGAGDWKISP